MEHVYGRGVRQSKLENKEYNGYAPKSPREQVGEARRTTGENRQATWHEQRLRTTDQSVGDGVEEGETVRVEATELIDIE